MPAYLFVIRLGPIKDAAEMAEYHRRTREAPPSVPLKPLVVYGALDALEGAAPDGVVMLQFDSVEDARTWYQSPAYQAALPHRLKAADYLSFIVEGV